MKAVGHQSKLVRTFSLGYLIAVSTICLAQPRHISCPHMLATNTSSLCRSSKQIGHLNILSLSLLGLPEVPSMALPSAPVPGGCPAPGATPSMLGLFKFGGAPG